MPGARAMALAQGFQAPVTVGAGGLSVARGSDIALVDRTPSRIISPPHAE